MKFAIGSEVWPGLSKLIEECGEVQQVCGKLLGTDGKEEHWDGSNLRLRLEEEIADLRAAVSFVISRNGLNVERIEERVYKKISLFNSWHDSNTVNELSR